VSSGRLRWRALQVLGSIRGVSVNYPLTLEVFRVSCVVN
jgi:hypothetical protein